MTPTALRIPYTNLAVQHVALRDELLAAAGRVLDHGKFILGPEVEEFEGRFAALCGVDHAVGVGNGTDALVLALRVLNIGAGDEVITPPNSFVASAAAIALVGARPVFVDVADDLNIDVSLIEAAITPRTRAILPVHLTGRPAQMGPLMKIARDHNLRVIEDCAQAVCAESDGRRVGSFGDVGCFSLHPLKTLNACGDGGVLTTADPAIARRLRELRNLGLETRDECVEWSGNSRLDTLQAALLLVKLAHLDDWTERRRAHAATYRQLLDGVRGIELPVVRSTERAVHHTFVIQADRRADLRAFLSECGVGTQIHYPVPIHLQSAARDLGYGPGSFPVAESQAGRILSLPVYPELTAGELALVASSIRSFYSRPSA
jgi:dTDP-4-amino-4,6-dideoxygalactose transaminase